MDNHLSLIGIGILIALMWREAYDLHVASKNGAAYAAIEAKTGVKVITKARVWKLVWFAGCALFVAWEVGHGNGG